MFLPGIPEEVATTASLTGDQEKGCRQLQNQLASGHTHRISLGEMSNRAHWLIALSFLVGCKETQTSNPGKTTVSQAASKPSSAPAAQANSQPAGQAIAQKDGGEGKVLFLKACANCHGTDGTGSMMRKMMPKIGDLTSAELHGRMSDSDIKTLIKEGREQMPPFGTVYSDSQIQAVIAYVRTLKR